MAHNCTRCLPYGGDPLARQRVRPTEGAQTARTYSQERASRERGSSRAAMASAVPACCVAAAGSAERAVCSTGAGVGGTGVLLGGSGVSGTGVAGGPPPTGDGRVRPTEGAQTARTYSQERA
eukprot:gene34988-43097_t